MLRAAPEAYDRKDQQDVRNEVQRLSKDAERPQGSILVTDITNGKLYYIQVNAGTLEAVAV